MVTAYIPSADTNKDGQVSAKELRKWNKSGRPVDTLDVETLAQSQGYAAAVLESFPELGELLNSILKEGLVDPNLIAGRITSSDWFKSYLPSYIEAVKAKAGMSEDIWNARIGTAAENMKRKFAEAGAQISDDEALKYAEQMYYGSSGDVRDGNWEEFDDAWLDQQIKNTINFKKTKTVNGVEVYDLSGKAEETARALYDAAFEYGVDTSMSNKAFTNWFESSLSKLMAGEVAVEDVDDELVDMALSRFPGLAPQLQRGLTLRAAADPYLNALARELEMDPGSMSLDDDLVQRVLNNVDDKGQFKPMSLYDAKLVARRDGRWQYTDTAKKEYTDIASTILKDFGFLG